MQRNIKKIATSVPTLPTLKRVAAYARVSSGKDAMLHSLSVQVSYYSNLIQKNPEWQYVGVYADEAMTGTKSDRPEFQRLLSDCRNGKIDMVITKSISRFARNTVTMLETVRELKSIGVDVYFEEQNIHSTSGDGELMITIMASFAQEESCSASENCKWRVREDFKNGIVPSITMLGYRRTPDGGLEIEPREAEIVHMIFNDFLSGMGQQAIANKLNKLDIPTRRGYLWRRESVGIILQNEKYTGDMLLQKTFNENHLTKRKMFNKGQLPMYLVQGSHEAIINKVTFETVQAEIKRRAEVYTNKRTDNRYPFSGKITCGNCGASYRRKLNNVGTKYENPVWICTTFNLHGKKHCPTAKQVPEKVLLALTAGVLGLIAFDKKIFSEQIDSMVIPAPNQVLYRFKDGHEITRTWADRSRRDSWTDEMRRTAGEKSKARIAQCLEQEM
jgi:site-specific DNA recombinase